MSAYLGQSNTRACDGLASLHAELVSTIDEVHRLEQRYVVRLAEGLMTMVVLEEALAWSELTQAHHYELSKLQLHPLGVLKGKQSRQSAGGRRGGVPAPVPLETDANVNSPAEPSPVEVIAMWEAEKPAIQKQSGLLRERIARSRRESTSGLPFKPT